jgi:hypothetical protein
VTGKDTFITDPSGNNAMRLKRLTEEKMAFSELKISADGKDTIELVYHFSR